MSEKTLKERLEEMEQKIGSMNAEDKKKNEKKFRLPFGKKIGNSQRRKNWVTVVKLHENGGADIKKLRIEDQTIMEEGIPRLATSEYVFYYKKNPIIFLPSWSVKPFSPGEHQKESIENGSNTKGYSILMDKMQKEQVEGKKKMNGMLKWLFGLVIFGIIGYAFISGGI